jgi:hypothetical protein
MEYSYDCKLFATIRVQGDSEPEARQALLDALDCASANLGAWPNGDPILCEASIDGEPDLLDEEEPRQAGIFDDWLMTYPGEEGRA